ncbi:chloride channel protein [Capillimicrobium parvum]|uniref:Ion-transport protein YfeO n=1 Tax=Capillimicrobium parvum TaxID=2884022 RepID=A0A9E6XXT9_9ACTN|nr:chloride channel protein [Capillimicrobium parvum]UGS36380.1 Putative ion-transport protein YfeO [Capillimicrobium parvum]
MATPPSETAPTAPKAGRRRGLLILAAAIIIGVVDGLLFMGFEWVVNHGLDWIWNDVFDTDDERWRVVPLALALGLLFGVALRLLRQDRLVEPHTDPMAANEDADPDAPLPRETLWMIGVIILVGLASLLAGASLGPEAPLVGATSAIGVYVANRIDPGPEGRLLVLCSVGALLVAFFGSLVPIALPILVLVQRTRRLPIPALIAIVLSGAAAYGTLYAVQGGAPGFGSIPFETGAQAHDYATALLLGIACVPVGLLLRWLVEAVWAVAKRVDAHVPWWITAAGFGAVLGVWYLIGGETVQFSGSEGSGLLLHHADDYGWAALAGIVLMKIVATAWSLGTGYRGGLVFPSVFCGVALGLTVGAIFGDQAGPGLLIGAVGGILAEMTAPVVGVIMLVALLPAKYAGIAVMAAVGVFIGRWVVDRAGPRRAAAPDAGI